MAGADLANVSFEDLVEALIQRCPPAGRESGHIGRFLGQPGSTIGWDRDAPAFGIVVGISLLGAARVRFQRGKRERRRTWEARIAPRSGYVASRPGSVVLGALDPPTKELRYSITFRTLKDPQFRP